jgi:hypothetical protein
VTAPRGGVEGREFVRRGQERRRHRLDWRAATHHFRKHVEALGDKEMAQPKESDDRPVHIPEHLIETINQLVRTSRQMLTEIGREPTPEELAAKLAIPLEKVRKLLNIAKAPISLRTATGD